MSTSRNLHAMASLVSRGSVKTSVKLLIGYRSTAPWLTSNPDTDMLSLLIRVLLPRVAHTPGIGYFWSGCTQTVKRGLEILDIALVDTDTREAFALRAVQTLLGKVRLDRTPECVAHIDKDSLIRHYLLALYNYKKQLLELSNIIVADAFFSKSTLVEGLRILGFELVSRFRDDARLKYLYTGEQKHGRGRPKTFDGIVDLANLRNDVFQCEELSWDKQTVTICSAVVYAVSLKRKVNRATASK